MLRVATDMAEQALELSGQVLDVAGNRMKIGQATQKPVMANDILFSRHVISDPDHDENEFLARSAQQLKQLRVRFRKLLPGKQQTLRGPDGEVHTRSLMVADLDLGDSLILLEEGLGDGRAYGCGLFIHHKGIKAVKPEDAG